MLSKFKKVIHCVMGFVLFSSLVVLSGCEGDSTSTAPVANAEAAIDNEQNSADPGERQQPEEPTGELVSPPDSQSNPGETAPAKPTADTSDVLSKNPFANEPRFEEPATGNVAGGVGGPATVPATDGQNAAGTARRPADVGVGKKGRSLDNETGVGRMIVQPAISFFAFREKAVFTVQIPSALKLYKGAKGHFPKSHQEFMAHIIQANRIQLPELQAGHRYVYDPKQAQLMVEFRK